MEAYNELIISYTNKFLEPSIDSPDVMDMEAISEKIIQGDVNRTVQPVEDYYEEIGIGAGV